jgi:hypothetical protein
MWTYLTTPFLLKMHGVDVHEVEPWPEERKFGADFAHDFPLTLLHISMSKTSSLTWFHAPEFHKQYLKLVTLPRKLDHGRTPKVSPLDAG